MLHGLAAAQGLWGFVRRCCALTLRAGPLKVDAGRHTTVQSFVHRKRDAPDAVALIMFSCATHGPVTREECRGKIRQYPFAICRTPCASHIRSCYWDPATWPGSKIRMRYGYIPWLHSSRVTKAHYLSVITCCSHKSGNVLEHCQAKWQPCCGLVQISPSSVTAESSCSHALVCGALLTSPWKVGASACILTAAARKTSRRSPALRSLCWSGMNRAVGRCAHAQLAACTAQSPSSLPERWRPPSAVQERCP